MTKFYCDLCAKEITNKQISTFIQLKLDANMKPVQLEEMFCTKCTTDIANFIQDERKK